MPKACPYVMMQFASIVIGFTSGNFSLENIKNSLSAVVTERANFYVRVYRFLCDWGLGETAVAFFVFLAATTWAWVVWHHLRTYMQRYLRLA